MGVMLLVTTDFSFDDRDLELTPVPTEPGAAGTPGAPEARASGHRAPREVSTAGMVWKQICTSRQSDQESM
jgi:hypothetical protein